MPRFVSLTLALVALPAVLGLSGGMPSACADGGAEDGGAGGGAVPPKKIGDGAQNPAPDTPGVKLDVKTDVKTDVETDASVTSRQERAQRLVKELETTITILKAAGTADADTLKSLERALAEARALARPVTLAELTDAERASLADEVAAAAAAATGNDGGNYGERDADKGDAEKGDADKGEKSGPGSEWRDRAIAAAFKDAGLNEEEQLTAGKIIAEWFDKSRAAQFAGESKRVSDLKQTRNAALEKALGRKKAQKVINNLNGMSGRRR